MSWSEIKKAVNSNLDVSLDKYLNGSSMLVYSRSANSTTPVSFSVNGKGRLHAVYLGGQVAGGSLIPIVTIDGEQVINPTIKSSSYVYFIIAPISNVITLTGSSNNFACPIPNSSDPNWIKYEKTFSNFLFELRSSSSELILSEVSIVLKRITEPMLFKSNLTLSIPSISNLWATVFYELLE